MLRLAHVSDWHLLDPRQAPDLAVKLVSVHRSLDAEGRLAKARRAVAAARAGGATHLIVSGDLSETGRREQFERVAEVLHESGFAPEAITLVPGNHDAYGGRDAWRRALLGPLRAFAATSANDTMPVVEREGVALLPLDVSRHQSVLKAGGELTREAARALASRLGDPVLRDRAIVIVQHHPPLAPRLVDGLRGYMELLGLLRRHVRVRLLHGHMHRVLDRAFTFGASATVDDSPRAPRVRFYEAHAGVLRAA